MREAKEKDREMRLQNLLLEGLNSGGEVPLDEKFWKDLRGEARETIEERKKRRK
jgi:hypothetical protein